MCCNGADVIIEPMNRKSLTQVRQRIGQHPVQFMLRQLYRLIIVYPWVLGVGAVHWIRRAGALKKKSDEVARCVIMTSIILPGTDKQVSHGSPRTVFSPEERSRQTMETIRSIRARLPGARIVLVEGGLHSDASMPLAEAVDEYLYVGDRSIVRWACDSSNKSMGEAVMLITALARMVTRAQYYFKISGRYILSDRFNISAWKGTGFSFLQIKHHYISTRLYGFSAGMLPLWRRALWQGIALHIIDYPIEYTLTQYIPKRYITLLSVIGVSGIGGSSTAEVIQE